MEEKKDLSNIRLNEDGKLMLPDGTILDKDALIKARLPMLRNPRNQMRWKKGSYLTADQVVDEEHQTNMKIA